MYIIILNSEEEVAARSADIVSHQLATKPDSVLGLSAGVNLIKMYRELVDRYRQGDTSFAHVKAFNVNEYLGLKRSDPRSYSYYLQARFFNQIDINMNNTHSLSCAVDAGMESLGFDYEDKIDANGGIDLQVLGLGTDGHIGFNAPGCTFASRTRVVKLTESALKCMPRNHRSMGLAATMGLRTIRDAQHIVLLASGSHKAAAIQNALEGEMSIQCPASCLQMHSNVTVIVDEAAARELELREHYKALHQNRLPVLNTMEAGEREKSQSIKQKDIRAIFHPSDIVVH
jgi:glucosamine-6-phosphate deaminase